MYGKKPLKGLYEVKREYAKCLSEKQSIKDKQMAKGKVFGKAPKVKGGLDY